MVANLCPKPVADVPLQQVTVTDYLVDLKDQIRQENEKFFSTFNILLGLMVIILFTLVVLYYTMEASEVIMQSNNIPIAVSIAVIYIYFKT